MQNIAISETSDTQGKEEKKKLLKIKIQEKAKARQQVGVEDKHQKDRLKKILDNLISSVEALKANIDEKKLNLPPIAALAASWKTDPHEEVRQNISEEGHNLPSINPVEAWVAEFNTNMKGYINLGGKWDDFTIPEWMKEAGVLHGESSIEIDTKGGGRKSRRSKSRRSKSRRSKSRRSKSRRSKSRRSKSRRSKSRRSKSRI